MQKTLLLLVVFFVVNFGYSQDSRDSAAINTANIRNAGQLLGLNFTDAERDSMLNDLKENLTSYRKLRDLDLNNFVPPALIFNPVPQGIALDSVQVPARYSKPIHTQMPENREELAFYTVRDLGELIRTGQVRSVDLTAFFLERLKQYGPELECIITLTEDLAMEQARQADSEIAQGKYRGPLHGIPYGLKDLFGVKGYKTTWGAMPYKDQVIDENSTVYKKLRDAGAVLVAKFTLGALAWGDVWYGGQTKNPWNLNEGSSGSSAGSAAATAAGLVPFAIGTETWGSIVSPSTRCGVTGLRPTFGRVSRAGAMALAWSMDKVGPIARDAEDCAMVFDAIRGKDGIDQTALDVPFNYTPDIDIHNLRIGYTEELFSEEYEGREHDLETLEIFKNAGIELIPITLPDYPIEALSFILSAEAAAAFDQLTLSNRDSLMVRQATNAWPNVFRASRFIPAVEYLQANRARYQLIQKMSDIMKQVDLYIVPSFGGNNLLLTNLTGHPCVVVPNGFEDDSTPTSISFIGNLFDEANLIAAAKWYQNKTDFHQQHPPRFE